jgi:iron complex outermembrane recepter protein
MKLFLSFFVLLFGAAATHAQLASYSPLNAGFDQEITLRFNLNLAQDGRAKGLMGKTGDLYLWAGAGSSVSNGFEFIPAGQTDFRKAFLPGKLTSLGNNRWEISFNPRNYFGVPAGKSIAVLTLIVKNADGSAQTEDIPLKPQSSGTLNAVTVRAKKPFVVRETDKVVLNVQSDVTAAGSSLFEILQKAPGVSITGEDNLAMSGKAGVNVLIDGKPTYMSARELAVFLKATPGTTVDKIEIIQNPSSRYEAQGNAGIINIKLKKNRLAGTNGNIDLGYTQNVHHRTNLALNLNHRNGPVNIFGSYSLSEGVQHTDGSIVRNVTGPGTLKVFDNNTIDIDRWTGHNFRTGIDWYINKKSTIGILVNGTLYKSPFATLGKTFINSNGITDSSLSTLTDNLYDNTRFSYNLNYSFEDTLGNALSIDGDITRFNNNTGSLVQTDFLNQAFIKYNYGANRLDLTTDINIYSAKADYTKTLKAWKGKLEAGVKWNSIETVNNLYAGKWASGQLQTDTGRSNNFVYKENVQAAYVTVARKIRKWDLQAGLRAEHTQLNGVSTDLRNTQLNQPDTSYLNIFPTAYARYTINDTHTVNIAYGRRINRPGFQDLNPFENIFDAYTSEQGNPYLRPQYTQNLELGYTYRNALSVSLGYGITRDYSQTIARQVGEKGTAAPQNVGKQRNLYLNINLPIPVTKWWYSYAYIGVFYNQYEADLPNGFLNNKAGGMNWYVSESFTLPKSWKLQLSSWGNTATKDALFTTKWLGSIDLGVQKNVLKDKATVKLSMIDLFNTQRWSQSANFGNLDFVYNRKWESRGIRLNIGWRFGKTKFSKRERRNTGEEESKRIRAKSA